MKAQIKDTRSDRLNEKLTAIVRNGKRERTNKAYWIYILDNAYKALNNGNTKKVYNNTKKIYVERHCHEDSIRDINKIK